MRLLSIPILALIVVLSLTRALAAPSTQRSADVRKWLEQLADADPDVRETARQKLMSLSRSDLPELRRIVADSRPLAAAQVAALHDIVVHVHTASAPYQYDDRGSGFMGVQLYRDYAQDLIQGAVIRQRFPGLVAFQMLRDGDVIVGAEESSMPIIDSDTLQHVITLFGAGQTVHLKVHRAGRLMIIPIKLDFRPANTDAFANQRAVQIEEAEQYWEENIRPLLEEATS
jgi:hypothetical protein